MILKEIIELLKTKPPNTLILTKVKSVECEKHLIYYSKYNDQDKYYLHIKKHNEVITREDSKLIFNGKITAHRFLCLFKKYPEDSTVISSHFPTFETTIKLESNKIILCIRDEIEYELGQFVG